MWRFVNYLLCREDFWRKDFFTYFIGNSFCLPFPYRLSGTNFYYILLSARGPPLAGRNSSPGPDFQKLFPYEYRLKCKYIHPWRCHFHLFKFSNLILHLFTVYLSGSWETFCEVQNLQSGCFVCKAGLKLPDRRTEMALRSNWKDAVDCCSLDCTFSTIFLLQIFWNRYDIEF